MELNGKIESLRVLIVEDSDDDCHLLVRHIREQGFELIYTRVDDAQTMQSALAQSWDLVISDFNLPRFSGPEAYSLLNSNGLDTPFIIVSGAIGEDIAVESMRSGVSDYILKSKLSRLGPAIKREILASRQRVLHKQTEEILFQTEEQLRQSHKMQAIGELAGGIAHDFNNMLSVMQLYSHKIAQSPQINPEIRDQVGKILNIQNRAAALTKQLLTFSQRQPVVQEPVNVNSVLENMKVILEGIGGQNLKLNFNLASDLGWILANTTQVEQIIMNLSVNARDSMKNEGNIFYRTSTIFVNQPLQLLSALIPSGDYALLEIQDTGSGIGQNDLKRLFEPFFTTKSCGKGTGLGLSIIYGIVHQYGGGIDVITKLNQGTVFKIYLPLCKSPFLNKDKNSSHDPNAEFSTSKRNSKEIQKHNKQSTILLVEDEAELRSLIAEMLTQEGYRILEAENGEEALAILEDPSNSVDLLITDMMMPKMNGAELHQKIKNKLKIRDKFPIVYMSGFFKDLAPEDSLILEKPFTQSELTEKIKSALKIPN
jgi:two-component system, cell cycle sensor histidine kinase and response regulator CckA